VVGPRIRLGEIAEVITDDQTLTERLLMLDLGRAAMAGEKMKISQSFIKIVLYREGYDLKTIQFSGADETQALTSSQDYLASRLLPEAKQFVCDQLKENADNVEVELAGLDKNILLPAGEVTARFLPPFSGRYDGMVLLTTKLEVDGREVKDLPLRLTVEVMSPVVVTTQPLSRGDKFSQSNVALIRWPESRTPPGAMKELQSVLGRTSNMPMVPNTVVRLDNIFDPPVIHRGQEVDAIVRQGNVELSVVTQAIEDGKLGDTVRVENTESHKLLRGKVLDEKTVLIEQEQP